MLRGFLLLAVSVSACLAQSDANQGFVNQHLIEGLHLIQPLQPQLPSPAPRRKEPEPVFQVVVRTHTPCIRIAPQERIPVDPQIDPGIAARASAPNIDRQMVIQPPPACPEP